MFVVVLKVVVVDVDGDDLELGQGSEEVASVALLVGVSDELSVQLLVTGQGDATGLLVLILKIKRQSMLVADTLLVMLLHSFIRHSLANLFERFSMSLLCYTQCVSGIWI